MLHLKNFSKSQNKGDIGLFWGRERVLKEIQFSYDDQVQIRNRNKCTSTRWSSENKMACPTVNSVVSS